MTTGTLRLTANHRKRTIRFDPRQGVLDLLTGVYADDSDLRALGKKAFWMLSVMSIVLMILYVYLINSAIINTVRQNDIRASVAALQTDLLNYEYSYLEKAGSINLHLAYEKGFVDALNPHFLGGEKRDTLLSARDNAKQFSY